MNGSNVKKDQSDDEFLWKRIHCASFWSEQVSMESDKNGVTTWRTQSIHGTHHHRHHTQHAHISTHSTNNVLRARRGVVRMLMVVVLTFALCNLPLHARKMWQYWWGSFDFPQQFSLTQKNFQQVERLQRWLKLQRFVHATHISRHVLQLGCESFAVRDLIKKLPQRHERASDLLLQAEQEQSRE